MDLHKPIPNWDSCKRGEIIMGQTDIFSMFNMVDESKVEKEKQEALAKKEKEEKLAKMQEEMKQKMEAAKKDSGTPGASAPAKKESAADAFKPDEETIIRFMGETMSITAFFSPEELAEGLLVTKKDQEPERQPLTAEMLRARMEKEYPELVKNHTDMVFMKKKNLVVPVMKAKAKGSDGIMPMHDSHFPIPFNVLNQFITLANFYAQYKLEIHADIYYSTDSNEYVLDVPAQEIHRYRTEVTEDAWSIANRIEGYIKLMEIHSHHEMQPAPSDLDDSSERVPGMVYAIVGKTTEFFPRITARQFLNEEIGHIQLHPKDIFESPFDQMPVFDSEGIEVVQHG